MKYTSFENMNCSVAQALTAVGERWTLLILRDAFLGAKRFGQFQRSLGIARNVLSARLNHLVAEGILEKRVSAEGAHPEYLLTEAGRDLQPVLLALTQWGDKHRPNPRGERLIFTERDTGTPIRQLGATNQDGRPLRRGEIKVVAGPGFGD